MAIHSSSISTRMAVARRSRALSLWEDVDLSGAPFELLLDGALDGVGGSRAPPVGLRQREHGRAFGDGAFEPRGELRRALGIFLDDAGELGLGAGAVRGVTDGPQLAADGLSCGSAGGVMDGVAGEVELAALPDRAGEDGLARCDKACVVVAGDEAHAARIR